MSLNKDVIGGYPVDLFVVSPSPELICPICHDVFKNPNQCKNGHNFCLSCITQAVESHRECPVCKTYVAINTLSPSLALRNIIEQLSVRCKSNTGDTSECHWSGKLVDLERHKSECTAEMVPCPLFLLGNCNKCAVGHIPRGKLDRHFLTGLNEDTPSAIVMMSETVTLHKRELDKLKQAVVPGYVVMKYSNGDVYSGEKLNGLRHGQGTMKYAHSGLYYSGGWKEGKKSGFGVAKCENGVYSGEFVDEKRVGQGCYSYENGETYSGSWKDDTKDGFGVNRWPSGSMYVGDWVNGLTDGYGVYTWSDGNKYEGHYKNDMCNGNGKHSYANGDVYEGNWLIDLKSGDGVMTYADGSVYTGQFLNDERHGRGVMKAPDGTVTEGVWKDDILNQNM